MEYLFGKQGATETLRTKGTTHTDLSGWRELEQTIGDATYTDTFLITAHTATDDDTAGNCYDWYTIANHNRIVDRTATVRNVAGIAFTVMAESGSIDDTTAGEHTDLFAPWAYPVNYTVGNLRSYNNKLWRCIQAHTSQADWTPDTAVSLWKQAADPAEEWPEWVQPLGAHDCYNSGDKVSHNEKHWTSDIDSNVWEPGVYGWTEVTQD